MTPRDNRVTGAATKTSSAPPDEVHAAGEVRGMLRVLEQLGYDLDTLLASAGLQRRDVSDPDALLPSRACATVFENAHRERRVRNLALELAQRRRSARTRCSTI